MIHNPDTPIYGELTPGCMSSVVEICKSVFGLNNTSRVIDLGSGVGKPTWHFAANDVDISVGIECVHIRYMAAQRASLHILEESRNIPAIRSTKVGFSCVDILQIRTLAYFDIVYMFDCGFNPLLLSHISNLIGIGRCRYLVSYHNPAILHSHKFPVQLLYKQPRMKMFAGKNSRTAYFYSVMSRADCIETFDETTPDDTLAVVVKFCNADYLDKISLLQGLLSRELL